MHDGANMRLRVPSKCHRLVEHARIRIVAPREETMIIEKKLAESCHCPWTVPFCG
jgi:hypothetical protein